MTRPSITCDGCCRARRPQYAVMAARATAALGPHEKYGEATGRQDDTILVDDEAVGG